MTDPAELHAEDSVFNKAISELDVEKALSLVKSIDDAADNTGPNQTD